MAVTKPANATTFVMREKPPVVPAGSYKAVFEKLEQGEFDPRYGPGFRFDFKISGGQWDGHAVSTIISATRPPTPTNRLGKMLAGLNGGSLAVGEALEISVCIGRTYAVQVEPVEGSEYTRVGLVMPVLS